MDLESNVKLRFLNHEDPRAWFLIDLEKGEIHEPPELLFICKYDESIVGNIVTSYSKPTYKPFTLNYKYREPAKSVCRQLCAVMSLLQTIVRCI